MGNVDQGEDSRTHSSTYASNLLNTVEQSKKPAPVIYVTHEDLRVVLYILSHSYTFANMRDKSNGHISKPNRNEKEKRKKSKRARMDTRRQHRPTAKKKRSEFDELHFLNRNMSQKISVILSNCRNYFTIFLLRKLNRIYISICQCCHPNASTKRRILSTTHTYRHIIM